jgi:hypothetical protein
VNAPGLASLRTFARSTCATGLDGARPARTSQEKKQNAAVRKWLTVVGLLF